MNTNAPTMPDVTVKITGIPETILLCDAFVEALRGNPMRRMLRKIARDANQWRFEVTHIITGALRASHKAREISRTKWTLYTDENTVNPDSGLRAIEYAHIENARGDDGKLRHDFQNWTEEVVPEIIAYHLEEFARSLDLMTEENRTLPGFEEGPVGGDVSGGGR